MPSLDEHSTTEWLRGWQPEPVPEWPPAVRTIEGEPAVAERLASLGALLDEGAATDARALCDRLAVERTTSRFRTVLAQLGAARSLRLLHWLTEAELPEGGQIVRALLHDDGPDAAALHRTVEAFQRRLVLNRIFAPERLAALEAAAAEALTQETS